MGKFIITEEEKKHIRKLYEQSPQQEPITPQNDLEALKAQESELNAKLSDVQNKLSNLKRVSELEQKQQIISDLQKRLDEIEKYLKDSCGKLFKSKMCKTYFSEQEKISAQIDRLRGLAQEIEGGEGGGYKSGSDSKEKSHEKVSNWVIALGSVVTLLTTILGKVGVRMGDDQENNG